MDRGRNVGVFGGGLGEVCGCLELRFETNMQMTIQTNGYAVWNIPVTAKDLRLLLGAGSYARGNYESLTFDEKTELVLHLSKAVKHWLCLLNTGMKSKLNEIMDIH